MVIPQIAVVLNWRNQVNTSGKYSVHVRITIERESKYFKIKVPAKVSQIQWAGKEDQWVKNHPFAFEINNKIIEIKSSLNEQIKRAYNFNKSLSFDMIFKHLKRKGNSDSFYDYMQAFIDSPPEKLELNTIKKYKTCLLHLIEFRKKLHFSDIDNIFMRDFHRFLQNDKKLVGSTCHKYMQSFKRVIRSARRDNYLDPAQMEFLFEDLKVPISKARRTFLEPQEIKQLKAAKFDDKTRHLARDRDLFLFQIYTGYYYKDLAIFTKDQLVEDEEFGLFIIGSRDKNGNQTMIPLFKFPYAATILRKYKSPKEQKTVFNASMFVEEPAYNRNLKEIAKEAKIKKNITNKVARHTNAQLWVRYGAEAPIVSKMMGHIKEETTKSYYEVNIPEIVEGTKRVDFGRLGI
jgi:site-specific recombinase XerD